MNEKRLVALDAEYERPDHWNYKSDPYELRKYDQTIALVPPGRYTQALEIGCSEGAFTRRVAPLADQVLGIDVVPVALERARLECAALPNVHFRQLDLARDALDERFDLVFCAEVLYYIRWTRLRAVTRKIVRWLKPGGYLVAVHATNDLAEQWGFGPKGAAATHPLLRRHGVRLLRVQDEAMYSLALFQKVADERASRWRDAVEDICTLNYRLLAGVALRRTLARLGIPERP